MAFAPLPHDKMEEANRLTREGASKMTACVHDVLFCYGEVGPPESLEGATRVKQLTEECRELVDKALSILHLPFASLCPQSRPQPPPPAPEATTNPRENGSGSLATEALKPGEVPVPTPFREHIGVRGIMGDIRQAKDSNTSPSYTPLGGTSECCFAEKAQRITDQALSTLPGLIWSDLLAAMEKDPAQTLDVPEFVLHSTNGPSAEEKRTLLLQQLFWTHLPMQTIILHRWSHLLWTLKEPLMAKLVARYAKEMTGSDIHPGAVIGPGFFLDHGVGTVIGGTAKLGTGVTLFHNVTLGASNPFAVPEGKRNQQRHPTIRDSAVVFAGTTVLGGNTLVGPQAVVGAHSMLQNSILGENVYLGANSFVKNTSIGAHSVVRATQTHNGTILIPGTGNRFFTKEQGAAFVWDGSGI